MRYFDIQYELGSLFKFKLNESPHSSVWKAESKFTAENEDVTFLAKVWESKSDGKPTFAAGFSVGENGYIFVRLPCINILEAKILANQIVKDSILLSPEELLRFHK
jgi:hypothetical protein